jgi:CDP-diacylglycerol--glycerol-3-phosphate 3-phosphatidyltransferase
MAGDIETPGMRFHAGAYATPANLLTLGRIVITPVLIGLILAADDRRGASWAAFVLGVVVAVSDHYDGRLARRQGTTRSGAFLDPLADKIVVLGVAFSLVAVERFWWVPVALITVRELGITAMRTYYARDGLAIPARKSAKYKTLIQGIALLLAVLPPLEDTVVPTNIALWVAVVFTVVTGLQYVVDGRRATTRHGSH